MPTNPAFFVRRAVAAVFAALASISIATTAIACRGPFAPRDLAVFPVSGVGEPRAGDTVKGLPVIVRGAACPAPASGGWAFCPYLVPPAPAGDYVKQPYRQQAWLKTPAAVALDKQRWWLLQAEAALAWDAAKERAAPTCTATEWQTRLAKIDAMLKQAEALSQATQQANR